jgi:hypothetical protein
MVTTRRFPPPWRADKIPSGYVVRDGNGQALVYIYASDSEAEAIHPGIATAATSASNKAKAREEFLPKT